MNRITRTILAGLLAAGATLAASPAHAATTEIRQGDLLTTESTGTGAIDFLREGLRVSLPGAGRVGERQLRRRRGVVDGPGQDGAAGAARGEAARRQARRQAACAAGAWAHAEA